MLKCEVCRNVYGSRVCRECGKFLGEVVVDYFPEVRKVLKKVGNRDDFVIGLGFRFWYCVRRYEHLLGVVK